MKGGLPTWSDEVASMQAMITSLQCQGVTLNSRCEDMEVRRIVGTGEQPGSSSPEAVSKVISKVLQMDQDKKNRWLPPHHCPLEGPQVFIAKLHYIADATEIWRRASAPLFYNVNRIALCPHYTSSVAKARAAFANVRKVLQGRKGVRYDENFTKFHIRTKTKNVLIPEKP